MIHLINTNNEGLKLHSYEFNKKHPYYRYKRFVNDK